MARTERTSISTQEIVETHIKIWTDALSKPRAALGNLAICPFAAAAQPLIIIVNHDICPPDHRFDIIIYVLDPDISEMELQERCRDLGGLHPHLVFLPDHRSRKTEISGQQTNNGKHNLILCQWRDDLDRARKKLAKTEYYKHWNQDYLDEILSA